ncbi:hypothetical protein DRP53_03720 [candidate division WOR-3 bacterium]|uniref:PAS domain S-box protein n=1 Tax=candidate division WOR-3 bacterium TaxID=2052148 RepID=A0A660SLJ7_UNCW3|nr:MAG: hypothetical protein DRP53_03720 [candidate division WOR-3 bacterium]
MRLNRLLLIDDNPLDRGLTYRILKKEFPEVEVVEIHGPEDFDRHLKEGDFQLVITDYHLRWANGIEILHQVKAVYPDCPVIMFSGTGNEEIAVEAMKAGLDDYVIKSPRHFVRLPAAIRGALKHREESAAAHQAEARYRMLFEHAGNPIFTYDLDLRIIEINRIACDLFGKKKNQLLGRRLFELGLIHPEDRKRIEEDLKRILTGERIVVEKLRFLLPKGESAIFEITEAPIYQDKTVVAIITICRDITERERLLRALKESEDKYRTLVEQSHDAIFISRGNRFLFVNDRVSEMTGYTKSELYQMKIDGLIHPEDQVLLDTSGIPKRYVARIITKTETTHWGEFAVTRINYQDQPAVMVAVRDITDRVKVEENLKRSLDQLRRTIGNTLQAMAKILETRDPFTAGHQIKVAELARKIAQRLGLSEKRIEGIYNAALIHDIGKISVPAEILSRPSKLTKPEFDLVKNHCRIGYEILKGIDFPWPVAEIVLQHHERLDGSGYPQGLKGDRIMLEARILAVADVFEAMTSHRPYRPALTTEAAIDELRRNRGILYDPKVVDVCIAIVLRGIDNQPDTVNLSHGLRG